MNDKIYEEIGPNYRFFLAWRHAAFGGGIVVLWGAFSMLGTAYEKSLPLAWLIPLLTALAFFCLWIIDCRTRQIYRALTESGRKMEEEGKGPYHALVEIGIPKNASWIPQRGQTRCKLFSQSFALTCFFLGSAMFSLFASVYVWCSPPGYASIPQTTTIKSSSHVPVQPVQSTPNIEFKLPEGDVLLVIAQIAAAILAFTIVASVVSRLCNYRSSKLDGPQFRLTSLLCFVALLLALIPFVIGEFCIFWNELAWVQDRGWHLSPVKASLVVGEVLLILTIVGHLALGIFRDIIRGAWRTQGRLWSWPKCILMTIGHCVVLWVQLWYFWALSRGRNVDEMVGPYLIGVTWLMTAAGINLMWFVGRSIALNPGPARNHRPIVPNRCMKRSRWLRLPNKSSNRRSN